MGDANREALLTALREQRRGQGRVEGVLVVECPMTSCPVGEVSMRVRGRAGGHLVQPKLKCPSPAPRGGFPERRLRDVFPFHGHCVRALRRRRQIICCSRPWPLLVRFKRQDISLVRATIVHC
jgi:hypothetical protein